MQSQTERISVVELTAEAEALDAALAACGLADPEQRDTALSRLISLPPSLAEPIWRRRGLAGTSGLHKQLRPDADTLAQMLRLQQGKLDPNCTWKNLSRAERYAANRLWDWFGDLSDISAYPKGRDYSGDPAVVLYCIFLLREALGRSRSSYSTSLEGERGGPFFRALIAALEAHRADELRLQQQLDRCGPIGLADVPATPKSETIRTLLRVANSPTFKAWARQFGLPLTSGAVADDPASFRHLLALTKRQRKPAGTD